MKMHEDRAVKIWTGEAIIFESDIYKIFLPASAIDKYWAKYMACREGGNSLLFWVTPRSSSIKICAFL